LQTPHSRTTSRRRVARSLALALSLPVLALGAALLLTSEGLASFGRSPERAAMAGLAKQATYQQEGGRFVNKEPKENFSPSMKTMLNERFFGKAQRVPPAPLPLMDPRQAWSAPAEDGLRVTWLGHSTLLLEVEGFRVLTDPIWSERASPSTIAGPERFHPPVVPLGELPPLDAVIISHDHYDHLDMPTIRALAQKGVPFFVPLGVGAHLAEWGVPPEQVTELDWWGEVKVKEGLTLVATPSRHFSGRGLGDRDRTLWASWVVRTQSRRVYFSGDTGLTPQFREIGRRHGPFDLVMLEVGAYHPSWGDIHLGPENALTALEWLGGGLFLPIHWGTFNLGMHAWDEPPSQVYELARARGLPFVMPRVGQPVEVGTRGVVTEAAASAEQPEPWWRQVGTQGQTASAQATQP
jgi:L-ascorbate metabolism protein UlaG (beta-lactamase superfamily)